MKKKLAAILAALMMVSSLTGCGEESTTLKDLDVDKYVTLGEYKGLEVTVENPVIEDEAVEMMADSYYMSMISMATGVVVEDGITDRAVAEGDIINIDYVGKLNDVAFDGGTAEDAYLGIGYGMFIEGFEEGLVGVMPGETVDLNLSFPENYGSAELAGQAVVFTVTVNYIMPEGYHPEIVSMMGLEGVTDEASLKQYAREYLEELQLQNQELVSQDAVVETFINGCTFEAELPKEILSKYQETATSGVESMANMYGEDKDTMALEMYGVTYEQLVNEVVPNTLKRDIAFQAVANRENLNVSDEELNSLLVEEIKAYGYEDVDAFLTEAGTTKEEYRDYYMYEKVLAYLVENATITE